MCPFTPVNSLEELLVDAVTDPAARPAFYHALPENELFFITEGRIPEGEGREMIGQEDCLQVRKLDIEGTPHTPLFTSVERISAVVPEEVGYMAMHGRDLLTALRGNDIVLNPGAPYGKLIPADEVEAILDGSIFDPQEHPDVDGKKIQLWPPHEYPHHITDALSRLFPRLRQVKAAYVVEGFIPEVDDAPHTMIGLKVSSDWQRVIEDVGVVIREVVESGEIVDLVQVTSDKTDFISNYMRLETKPFYKRRLFGIF